MSGRRTVFETSGNVALEALRRASKPKPTWRSTDQRYALAEGWCVITNGDYVETIQRDDDQPEVFKDDIAASRHVRRCARAGSLLHKRALAYVLANS